MTIFEYWHKQDINSDSERSNNPQTVTDCVNQIGLLGPEMIDLYLSLFFQRIDKGCRHEIKPTTVLSEAEYRSTRHIILFDGGMHGDPHYSSGLFFIKADPNQLRAHYDLCEKKRPYNSELKLLTYYQLILRLVNDPIKEQAIDICAKMLSPYTFKKAEAIEIKKTVGNLKIAGLKGTAFFVQMIRYQAGQYLSSDEVNAIVCKTINPLI